MRAHDYILAKQVQWAKNRGIALIGSKGERGRPVYTVSLDNNLFQPMDIDVLNSFKKGDGNEVKGTPGSPAKMQALHSSSALSVNVFQYWKKINKIPIIAAEGSWGQGSWGQVLYLNMSSDNKDYAEIQDLTSA